MADKETFGLDKDQVTSLTIQFQNEKIISEEFMQPKWREWRRRLKILNNQKRKDTDIGEPLAHTHFNTVLAALYDDKLSVEFLAREPGDVTVTESLNPLYEYDIDLMDKRKMDYKWLWNTLFFGRSLVMMFEFDRENLVPRPEVVNMLTWYRDPNATSVNGDSSGRGSMRFGGRSILLTKKEMEDAGFYKNIDQIAISTREERILEAAKDEIRRSQGFNSNFSQDVTGENSQRVVTEWLTFFEGKRVVIGMANGGQLLVRYNVLKDQDEWGIIDQVIYPNELSWDGTSLLDLIEDKQRAKAKLINAAMFTAETNSNHMYMYDMNKIQNESDLDFEHNKHIPISGDVTGAIQPISRDQVNNEVQFMLNYLEQSAGKATAATEISQGAVSGASRTATEIATVSEGVDTRFELMSKIIGWSEKAFAQYWYKMYKMHFKDKIDEKIVRIVGQDGLRFKSFTRKNLIAAKDPDVEVNSKIVGEAKRLRKLQEFNSAFEILMADPTINRDVLFKDRAKLAGFTEMEMQSLFKPNPEQVLAIDENEKLNKNESVNVNPTDDDLLHIKEHLKAAENKKTIAHIEDHWEMYIVKNKNPNVREEVEQMGQLIEQGSEAQPVKFQGQNFQTPRTIQTA